MLKKFNIVLLIIVTIFVMGCADTKSRSTGVYMLIDTSGTYTKQLVHAQKIINYLLVTLNAGDSLAIARIDSGSFSEKDIVAKMTFDQRPSAANKQKLIFKKRVDSFVKKAKGSHHTDISGGVLQAIEYLNEIGAGKKFILIFSDLEEDLAKGQIRDFPISMDGIKVVALNVTKLRSDNIDPRKYYKRVEQWKKKVNDGGGSWKVINDLERIEKILKE
jgi:hypothetical protein